MGGFGFLPLLISFSTFAHILPDSQSHTLLSQTKEFLFNLLSVEFAKCLQFIHTNALKELEELLRFNLSSLNNLVKNTHEDVTQSGSVFISAASVVQEADELR